MSRIWLEEKGESFKQEETVSAGRAGLPGPTASIREAQAGG